MRTLTDEMIDVLVDGGLRVGDGNDTDQVDGGGIPLAVPYVVVYPLVQTRGGTLTEPFSDIDKWHQATCIAASREQVEWLADRTESLLDTSDLVLTELVRSEAHRDDATAGPPLFICAVRARLRAHSPQEP